MSHAQDASTWTKQDVLKNLYGHELSLRRTSDQKPITWVVSEAGVVWATDSRGGSDKAILELKDNGEFCTRWKGRSGNACLMVLKQDGKLWIRRADALTGSGGLELVSIK